MRRVALAAVLLALPGCGDDSFEVNADRVVRGSIERPKRHDRPVALHAFSAQNAFVVLPGGRVLETVDAGRSWRRVPLHWPHGGARFLTRRHWLASSGRALYETRDGGRAWRFVRRLVRPFVAGHFVDDRFGFACEESCALTSDGGRTSIRIGPPPSSLCRSTDLGPPSFAFSDLRTGLAICGGVPGAGSQGKEFWRMADGRRWRLIDARWGYGYVGRIEPLGHAAFVHHSARLNDQLTADGGVSWRSGLPPESATFASWVDARVGWAFERHAGNVFRTVDGGRTWRRLAPSLWPARTSFCDPRVGFGVGEPWLSGPAHEGIVYATKDGGRRWLLRSRLDGLDVQGVVCLGPRELMVIAYPSRSGRFRLLRSRDGGVRWTHLRVPKDTTIPRFFSPRVFVAASHGPTLLATVDGGRSWQRLTPARDPVTTFAFRSPLVGFAVVSPEVAGKARPPERLLRTTDGGRSWRGVPIRVANLRTLDLWARGRRLWLRGTRCPTAGPCRPLVLRTDDDGRHWEAIEPGGEPPWEPRFASPSVGVAPDVRGLLVTRDGGVTWRWERRGGF